jgi:GTP-binding protein HflX
VRTRSLHRAARAKVPFPVVALAGYTNAGKSTLFNRITGAGVLAKDMLFATLDPTMRGVVLPSGRRVILSDTVGFISDLPTQLVAAFRATLEEVLEADLILHVRDIAHPETEEQAADVRDILGQLGVDQAVPLFEVWNKLDLVEGEGRAALAAQAARRPDVFPVSALTGEGVEALLAAVSDALSDPVHPGALHIPFAEARRRAWLHDQGVVTEERQGEDGWDIALRWTARQEAAFRAL